jgi:hypothetical protein
MPQKMVIIYNKRKGNRSVDFIELENNADAELSDDDPYKYPDDFNEYQLTINFPLFTKQAKIYQNLVEILKTIEYYKLKNRNEKFKMPKMN